MNRFGLDQGERRQWAAALLIAGAAHVAAGLALANWIKPAEPMVPDPVVLIELPPPGATLPAPANPVSRSEPVAPQATPARMAVAPLPEAPPIAAPIPDAAVTLPAKPALMPQNAPATSGAPSLAPPSAVRTLGNTSAAAGDNPRARKQEADYFSLLSAYLQRRKVYPAEAKQARQQGIVTVRFTVDRMGNISAATIKRSSNYDILDTATLDLLRRVSPLPAMPASMQRESITLSLPIEYALKTK